MTRPAASTPTEISYRAIYDAAPFQILVEDFGGVAAAFDRLRADGVTQLAPHLREHPHLASQLRTYVRVIDANPAAVAGLGYASKAELLNRLSPQATAPYSDIIDDQLVSLWEGRQQIENQLHYTDALGQSRVCLAQYSFIADDSATGPRAVLLLVDQTATQGAISARLRDHGVVQGILARANLLLWWGSVRRENGRMRWKIDVSVRSPENPILRLATGIDRGGLWEREYLPDYDDLVAQADRALLQGDRGYEREFRVVKDGRTNWLSEDVGIQRLGPDEWSLVGVVSDVTARREAEEAQRRDAALMRQILERTDCMLWQARVVERDGGFSWHFEVPFSGLQRRLFGGEAGIAFDGLTGGTRSAQLFGKFLVPQQADMDARCAAALRSGAPGYEQEYEVITPEQRFWLHEQVSIEAQGPGEWSLVGAMIDVTARHDAEEARRRSEEQLAQILLRADCLLWQARVIEADDGQLSWMLFIPQSVLYRKLFGDDPAGVRSLMWDQLNVADLQEMNQRSTTALRSGARRYEQEFRAFRDGQAFILHEQVSITPIAPGEWYLVGVITDISARREAEAELAAGKERLAVTLGAMAEGVISTDAQGVVNYLNRAAAGMIGRVESEAVGRPLAALCALADARTQKSFELPVDRVLREGAVANLPPQTSLQTPDGATRLVAGCCAPVRDAGRTIIGSVLMLRDNTEHQRLEEEMLRASKLESVGILAGGIAHDFNNILTAIMGNLTLGLLDAKGQPVLEQCLRDAQTAALRARDLTQQLLTFAKGGDPVRSAVPLQQIVTEVTRFALHGARVACEFDLPQDLWSADADRGQLGQVVQNLVINAMQSMPEGGTVHVSARNETVAPGSLRPLEPGDYVRLRVSDSGSGISPEHLERVFDPYFTTKRQGHGLGLATVYSIVKKHDGHIEAESTANKGTTFNLWLPAVRLQRSAPGQPAGTPFAPLHGRVLFMDDEEPIRKMATSLVRRLGLEIELASDGAEAVEKFRAAHEAGKPFDLVVTDLTVPGGMGGREAVERLREIDPEVKAIVSSGYSSDPVLANFRAYGFRGMVAKPYEIEDFLRVVRAVLEEETSSPS